MAFLFVDSLVPHNLNTRFRIAIKALELLLLSAGLISTLLMVKGSLMPYSCELVASSLVGFWNSLKCFLSSPLYICIIINFMVFLIVASSSFHRQEPDDPSGGGFDVIEDMEFDKSPLVSPPPAPPPPPPPPHNKEEEEEKEEEEQEQEEEEIEEEEEEEDTMDATWRAITGGGTEEATKKLLKKSETWNIRPPRRTVAIESLDSDELLPSWKELRKSETFNDAVSIRQRGGLRRDPTMSVDEFNNQVEAFIKKFNESIRLQRQESDQRFIDMVNRGL